MASGLLHVLAGSAKDSGSGHGGVALLGVCIVRNVAFDLLLILGGALAVGYGCAGLGAAAIALALYPFRVRS